MTDHSSPAAASAGASASAGSSSAFGAVDVSSLRGEARLGLAAAGRIRQYLAYLERARAFKASGAARTRPIDGQVLTHARAASDDIRTLAVSSLRNVRAMQAGGALDPIMQSGRRAIAAAGTVTAADVAAGLTSAGRVRDALQRAGADAALLDAVAERIRSIDARLSAGADHIGGLVVLSGVALQASLATTPRPSQPANVAALLARSRFDSVADALERGEPAYLDGVPFVQADVRAPDAVLFGALAACAEGVRHVRKIEDTGLDTHRGAAPGGVEFPVIAIVGLALLALGSLIWLADCGNAGPHPEDQLECLGAAFLMALGVILMLLGFGQKQPPGSDPGSTGTPLIHGVLRDFAGAAAR